MVISALIELALIATPVLQCALVVTLIFGFLSIEKSLGKLVRHAEASTKRAETIANRPTQNNPAHKEPLGRLDRSWPE